MQNNVGFGLTQQSVDEFSSVLSEEERRIRIMGEAAGVSSKVIKFDQAKHFISKKSIKDIPPDWVCDFSIDYHPSKSNYILVVATAPYDIKYVVHEIISPHGEPSGADWIGKEIVDCIKKNNLRVGRIIIDPLSKGFSPDENTIYEKVSRYLGTFGYSLETASKHKEDGVIMINDRLHNKGGIPTLYFYNDSLPVSMRQFKAWRYDEFGKPLKVEDDSCENLYRLIALDTKYTDPYEDEEVEYNPQQLSGRNSVTGY